MNNKNLAKYNSNKKTQNFSIPNIFNSYTSFSLKNKLLPPATKLWFNSIYNYNNNFSKLLPSVDNITNKIIKSYFSINPLTNNPYGKRSRLIIRRFRRLSLNRILTSKSEIKHFNDRILITVFLFNKTKKSLLRKLDSFYNFKFLFKKLNYDKNLDLHLSLKTSKKKHNLKKNFSLNNKISIIKKDKNFNKISIIKSFFLLNCNYTKNSKIKILKKIINYNNFNIITKNNIDKFISFTNNNSNKTFDLKSNLLNYDINKLLCLKQNSLIYCTNVKSFKNLISIIMDSYYSINKYKIFVYKPYSNKIFSLYLDVKPLVDNTFKNNYKNEILHYLSQKKKLDLLKKSIIVDSKYIDNKKKHYIKSKKALPFKFRFLNTSFTSMKKLNMIYKLFSLYNNINTNTNNTSNINIINNNLTNKKNITLNKYNISNTIVVNNTKLLIYIYKLLKKTHCVSIVTNNKKQNNVFNNYIKKITKIKNPFKLTLAVKKIFTKSLKAYDKKILKGKCLHITKRNLPKSITISSYSKSFDKINTFFEQYKELLWPEFCKNNSSEVFLNYTAKTEGWRFAANDKNISSIAYSSIENIINLHKIKFIQDRLERDLLYIYYLNLLSFNNTIFKNWFLYPLKNIIAKIYNKKVVLNLINLKYIYLNSDIFTQAITLRLKNLKKSKLYIVLEKALSVIALSKINYISFDPNTFKFKYIKNHLDRHLTLKEIADTFNVNKKSINIEKNENPLKRFYFSINRLNKMQANTINFIKYKSIFGVRLEASGRLTKRSTASRSVFKLSCRGTLRNRALLNKTYSSKIIKNNYISNLQFSSVNSKTRNGSFGLKGWINNN